ncbi:MAG: sarcosine oxidase subunit delta [Gammaproteobacteria bacterium]|nr:sarcosine oxidase subunit delta [Gammaproteobacteria bacterium]
MRIPCPCCGERPIDEFGYLGDATVVRPDVDDLAAWHDYVYLRDNPRGPHHEYWHHVGGCRAWLVVHRDTLTHEVFGATLASDWRRERP